VAAVVVVDMVVVVVLAVFHIKKADQFQQMQQS
jgi:hypothetical protein